MDIKKIEKRIKKISNLVELIKLDGKLSQIERDLLLDYVRKLYDELLNSSNHMDSKITNIESVHTEEAKLAVVPPPPSKVEKIETPQPKVEAPAPIIVEETATTPEVKPQPTAVEEPVDSSSEEDESLNELFVFDEIKDLSNKLGMAKISDINKAIGINERIFTIKELFGGDNDVYSSTISKLNNTNSFEEAKEILTKGVATNYNWSDELKFKKAQHFIRIVRRLYV